MGGEGRGRATKMGVGGEKKLFPAKISRKKKYREK
jgi:hypothetical protein